ncbi:hypothetical protein C0J50_14701 [Silurus asotus]|uniref:Uncharacterized protein n=1 Tax=Silurus asotus TaxID=30991 RepID=A0AAD5FRB3_SILAS|nr:hypothetical protein C0J50_14701 [Silurus asotus]
MPSSGDTEVFIPEQASVITVPACYLPSSITRKMSMCIVHSTCPATFISPVELRNKGTTETPRPLTPGQVLLPVVTSNQKAFRILKKFLEGENSLQISDETSPAGSSFSRRSHSIVLFDKQIFLVVTKAKACDWSLKKKRNPTPYECEAPPLDSPVTTQDGGSDITDGRNKEGTCGAEDDGKCAEKQDDDGLMECEEEDQFWLMFLRRYERNRFENEAERLLERLKERAMYHRKSGRDSLLPVIPHKIHEFPQRTKRCRKPRN